MYDCEVIGGPYKKENTKMNNDSKITIMYNKHIQKNDEKNKITHTTWYNL